MTTQQNSDIAAFIAFARAKGYSENCIQAAIAAAQKSGMVTRRALVNYLSDAVVKNCNGNTGNDAEYGHRNSRNSR